MKKIGIVGGVAWPSTLEYYRLICLGANEHFKRLGASPPYPTPLMTIESLVMNETRKLRGTPGGDDAEWTAFDAVFRGALLRLEQAGCEFGIIANNTSHTRLRTIRQGVTLPIISILEETAKATNASGAAKALVLGTSVTMRSNDYADLLRAHGVEPNSRLPEDTIDEIQRLIDTEFDQGGSELGRQKLFEFCQEYAPGGEDVAVLLACTELPLAFPEHGEAAVFEAEGLRFVNTTAVHVQAALNRALGLKMD